MCHQLLQCLTTKADTAKYHSQAKAFFEVEESSVKKPEELIPL